MLWTLIQGSTDLMVATIAALGLLAVLPALTFGTAALLHAIRSRTPGGSSGSQSKDNDDDGDGSVGALATAALLFVLKGLALFVLLLQASVHLGGAAACWLCAWLLELAARANDSSLRVLMEPPLQPLDLLFLFVVAPALSAPAGGVHGMAAAWLTYLCIGFFWRAASPATSVAIPMTLAAAGEHLLKRAHAHHLGSRSPSPPRVHNVPAYLFAWAIGFYEWRGWVYALELEPLPRLTPRATRRSLTRCRPSCARAGGSPALASRQQTSRRATRCCTQQASRSCC